MRRNVVVSNRAADPWLRAHSGLHPRLRCWGDVAAAIAHAQSGRCSDQNPAPTFTPADSDAGHVIVKSGDTLLSIAIEYGTTVADLQQANGIIDPGALQIGQELVIPVGPGGVESAQQILPTPTPLAAQVEGLAFFETGVGSLRCRGEVRIPTRAP
jgi:hypothetical protein